MRQPLEKCLSNYWKNIPPIIGIIFRQLSEKYFAKRRKKLYKIIFMVYNIVIEDGNEVF